MGRGGLYYRASLSSRIKTRTPAMSPRAVPVERADDALPPVETGEIVEMADTNKQDVLGQINDKLRMIAFWPFAVAPGLLAAFVLYDKFYSVAAACVSFAVVLQGMAAVYFDRIRRSVVLMYDLDADFSNAFEHLAKSIEQLAQSSAIWNIDTLGPQPDWKRHAGTHGTVTRASVKIGYDTPRVIHTNLSIPAIVGGRQSLYFFPDLLLVLEGRTAGGVSYEHLNVSAGVTNFVESETVPSDAQIVKHTWRYVNKNGGPDRRFNNNRQLPVALYQELRFSSANSLNKLVHISHVDDRSSLIHSVVNLAKIVHTALGASPDIEPSGVLLNDTKRSQYSPVSPLFWIAGLSLAFLAASLVLFFHAGPSRQYSQAVVPSSQPQASVPPAPLATTEQLTENQKHELEKTLLSRARSIPASRYDENLEAYRRLTELRPENRLYTRKMEHYKALSEKQHRTKASVR